MATPRTTTPVDSSTSLASREISSMAQSDQLHEPQAISTYVPTTLEHLGSRIATGQTTPIPISVLRNVEDLRERIIKGLHVFVRAPEVIETDVVVPQASTNGLPQRPILVDLQIGAEMVLSLPAKPVVGLPQKPMIFDGVRVDQGLAAKGVSSARYQRPPTHLFPLLPQSISLSKIAVRSTKVKARASRRPPSNQRAKFNDAQTAVLPLAHP